MPKTRITVAFEIPTTSLSRVQDVMGPIKEAVDQHKGQDFSVTIFGPIADSFLTATEAKANGKREDTEERTERGQLGRDGSDDDGGDDGDKPKRGRGRPRKSDDGDAKASGTTRRKRNDDEDGGGSEGTDGNEPERTRKGSDEGSGQGEGRSRGAGRSGSSERGNREASRVKDDDWGDEDDGGFDADEDPREAAAKSSAAWPDDLTPDDEEIDKPYITRLLGEHYNATGSKDRTVTFDLMEDVTGTRKLGEVAEEDYRKLAKALLKDTARYEFGVKKAK